MFFWALLFRWFRDSWRKKSKALLNLYIVTAVTIVLFIHRYATEGAIFPQNSDYKYFGILAGAYAGFFIGFINHRLAIREDGELN